MWLLILAIAIVLGVGFSAGPLWGILAAVLIYFTLLFLSYS
jgi:hypothetical protein